MNDFRHCYYHPIGFPRNFRRNFQMNYVKNPKRNFPRSDCMNLSYYCQTNYGYMFPSCCYCYLTIGYFPMKTKVFCYKILNYYYLKVYGCNFLMNCFPTKVYDCMSLSCWSSAVRLLWSVGFRCGNYRLALLHRYLFDWEKCRYYCAMAEFPVCFVVTNSKVCSLHDLHPKDFARQVLFPDDSHR